MSSAFRTRQPHEALPPEIYHSVGRLAFQGGPHPLRRNNCRCSGSVFITYWKTGEILLFYCAISRHLGRLCARIDRCARISARGRRSPRRKRRGDGNIVTSLERRRPSRCSDAGVTSRSLVPPTRLPILSVFHDNDLRGGIFGRNFGNARFVVVQDPVRVAADDGRADILRKCVSLDFCRRFLPRSFLG